MKRWGNMAKVFTRIGKDIAMAVKSGGGDLNNNPRLRMAAQNAKAANMPRTNVENAIKKALSKESENYEEVVYEGYAPNGIAILVETATDNPTRTVANVRHVFSKYGGSLGTTGSLSHMFDRKAIFSIKKDAVADREEFEFELIDAGLEEIKEEEDTLNLVAAFTDFGSLSKALEDKGLEILESKFDRIPSHTKKLSDEQVEEVIKLIEKMEDDDDVQNVFHNLDME